jgi:hypothetical protein
MNFQLSHTSKIMATCPLCSSRHGKRYCPAVAEQICAVCCGTKREIEIDCPSSCAYLKASRSYELDKPVPDPEVAAKAHNFDEAFFERYHPVLDAVTLSLIEEYTESKWLVDIDVIEVYRCLKATMKTLSSGLYYESLPEGTVRLSLFRRLKALFDEMMQPDPGANRPTLKVTEAIDVLDFLIVVAQANSSIRPKSRRYLDWVTERFGVRQGMQQSSGIILP